MRNPIKTKLVKNNRNKFYQAELFGYQATGGSRESAEANLLLLLDKSSRTTVYPTFMTIGAYTGICFFDHLSGYWITGIIAGPDRDGINLGGTSYSAGDYAERLADLCWHLASIQLDDLESLTVSTNGEASVENTLRFFPSKWDDLLTLRRYQEEASKPKN